MVQSCPLVQSQRMFGATQGNRLGSCISPGSTSTLPVAQGFSTWAVTQDLALLPSPQDLNTLESGLAFVCVFDSVLCVCFFWVLLLCFLTRLSKMTYSSMLWQSPYDSWATQVKAGGYLVLWLMHPCWKIEWVSPKSFPICFSKIRSAAFGDSALNLHSWGKQNHDKVYYFLILD